MRAPILVTFFSLSLLMSGSWARAQQLTTPLAPAPQPGAPAEQPEEPDVEAPAETATGTATGKAAPGIEQAAKAPTMAERRALARAQHEMMLRAMLTDFGIEDAAPQDAIVAYLAEEEAARRVVRGAAQRMMVAVRAQGAPQKTRDALAIYKAAIDADKERRRAAQSALDARIGFSLSPRLEATLWVLGVLGESQTGLPLLNPSQRAPKNGLGEAARDRNPDGNRDGARDGNRDGARRSGTVRGVVSGKAQGWIEVRADSGAIDRYLPFWAGGEPALNPTPGAPTPGALTPGAPTPAGPIPGVAPPGARATGEDRARLNRLTLETLARVKIGDRVSLDWVWSERKRVVRLRILSPETPYPATQAEPDQDLPAANPIYPENPTPVAPAATPATEALRVVAPTRRAPQPKPAVAEPAEFAPLLPALEPPILQG